MRFILLLLPICITLFVIGWRAWHSWKDGLFMTVLELVATIAASVLAFLLARLLINPAWVDLFGLGQLLVSKIPAAFFEAAPKYEAFLHALPTALIALLAYSILFELLRFVACKILSKLNNKHRWSEKIWHFPASRVLALGVGGMIAIVCILTDMVICTGAVAFSGEILDCAGSVTGNALFSSSATAVHALEENPLFRICDAIGCRRAFYALTKAQRNGESFSVGQELIQISHTLSQMEPLIDVLPTDGSLPTAEQLRALPQALEDTPEAMELLTGLIKSELSELSESDGVMILSTLLGTTPEAFSDYLAQLDAENAHEDLTTICQIVAVLADRELLPEAGGFFDLSTLSDPELVSQVQQILGENPRFAQQIAP